MEILTVISQLDNLNLTASGAKSDSSFFPSDKPQEKVRAPLHARVPAPLVMDFVSRPNLGQVAPIQRPPPSSGAQELQDRMRKKKGGDGKPERAVKISIEGRQMMM